MRVVAAVAVLLLASALAGCNNPVRLREPAAPEAVPLPWAETERGREFGAIVAPDWKPGYRFTYEEEGARHESLSGDVPGEEQDTVQDMAWGPRQGLNYTIANVTTVPFGGSRYLAVHSDATEQGGGRRLLAFSPFELEPVRAGIGMTCANGHGYGYGWDDEAECTNYVELLEGEPDAVPLDFPLQDGQARRDADADVAQPYVPWQPVDVRTRVLGLKEVDGPFGKVQAVHVHQDLALNFTDATNEDDWGPQDFQVGGQARAERDVYYAPALLSVVLDQSVSEGVINGSYELDGQRHAFERSWRSWSTQRLVDVALKPGPAMELDELAALLRYGADPTLAHLEVHVEEFFLNVAEGQATGLRIPELPEGAFRTSIEVYDGRGDLVASSDRTELDFAPLLPGPYLVSAMAHDARGVLLGRGFGQVWAHYSAEQAADCGPVAGDQFGACPGLEFPLGSATSYVLGIATMSDPLAGGDTGGRLVLEMGNGQEVSSDRQGSTAQVQVLDPRAEPFETWTLRYKPEMTVGQVVTYQVEVWPGSLPASVWDTAYRRG